MPSVSGAVARRVLRPLGVALAAAAVTAALPLAPAAAEGHRTVVGTLVQAYPEHRSEGPATLAGQPLSWVQQADGEAVRIPTDDVADVAAGSTVQVTVGAPVQDAATQDDGYTPARDVVSADVLSSPAADPPPDPSITDSSITDSTSTNPSSDASGSDRSDPQAPLTDQVTVAMVVPKGGQRDAATLDQLVAAVNGPVAAYWAEQSHGAIRLGVTAQHGWTTVDAACADPTALWTQTAQKVGFTPGPGKHLLVYVSSRPENLPGCSYGLAQVGDSLTSGGSLYVRDTLPSIIAHELGHNFGLGHSSEVLCDRAVETGSCQTQPYRDYYDVMGASWEQLGSLNAAQAARLGFLPAAAQRGFTSARAGVGEASLAPLSGSTGVRALHLTDSTGAQYWLEYRTPTGQDSWLDTAADRFGLQSGVLLHRSGEQPDTSLLLDGTPGPSAGWDDDLQAALPVGTPITVAGGQFTVTVEKQTAGSATIRVVTTPSAAAAPPVTGHAAPVLPSSRSGSATHRATGPATPPGATAVPSPHVGAAPPPLPPIEVAAPERSQLAPAAATSSTGLGVGLGVAAVGLGGLLLVLATATLRRRLRAERAAG